MREFLNLISKRRAVAVAVLIAASTALFVLSFVAAQGLSARTAAAAFPVMSFAVFVVGGVLYTGRAIWHWSLENEPVYLLWERGFVVTAVLSTVFGLALLADLLRAAGDSYLASVGFTAYLFGAVVVVTAETTFLGKRDWNYPQVVLYVALAFLAQAAFGLSLLQTGLVPAWAAWTALIWNVGWPVVLLVFRPRDIYFPVLHHAAPLVVGIALLTG